MKPLLVGVSLGWAAGISPGPLMMFVITTSLKKGARAGMRVALAPILTDTPMLIVSVVAARLLNESALDWLTGVGAAYLIWLGLDELRRVGSTHLMAESTVDDLRRAVWLNLTSPHPWVFWLTVGGPIVVGTESAVGAVLFLAGFYALLVGTKLATAYSIGTNAHRLSERMFRVLIMTGALGLVVFGFYLGWERFFSG